MLSRGSFKTRRETKTCIHLIIHAEYLAATNYRQYNYASGNQMATTAYFIPCPYAVLRATFYFVVVFILFVFFNFLILVLGNFAVIGDLFLLSHLFILKASLDTTDIHSPLNSQTLFFRKDQPDRICR